jgi:hypothetical protein
MAASGSPPGNPERKNLPVTLCTDAGAIVEESLFPGDHPSALRFKGVASPGRRRQTLWLAVQRVEGRPKGTEAGCLQAGRQSFRCTTRSTRENGWIGLSESPHNGGLIVERDNQVGRDAKVKKLTHVSVKDVTPAEIGVAEIPVLKKTDVRDLVPDLAAPGGVVLDKVESFAIDKDGTAFVITDNDGVDDHSGETQFIRLGKPS